MRKSAGATAPSFIAGVISREAHRLTHEIESVQGRSSGGRAASQAQLQPPGDPVPRTQIPPGVPTDAALGTAPAVLQDDAAASQHSIARPEQTRADNANESPQRGHAVGAAADRSSSTILAVAIEENSHAARMAALQTKNAELLEAGRAVDGMLAVCWAKAPQIRRDSLRRPDIPNYQPARTYYNLEGLSTPKDIIGDQILDVSDTQEAQHRLHMAKEEGKGSEEARWLVRVAELHEYSGRYTEALALCERCTDKEMVLFSDGTIGESILQAQFRQAMVGHKMGDVAMAVAILEDCFNAMSFKFDMRGLCRVQIHLGYLYLLQYAEMSACSAETSVAHEAHGDPSQLRKRKLETDQQRALAATQALINDYAYLMKKFVLTGEQISDSDLHALPSVASANLRTSDILLDSAAELTSAGHDSSELHGLASPRIMILQSLPGVTDARGDGPSMYPSMIALLENVLDKTSTVLRDSTHKQSAELMIGFEDLCFVLSCVHKLQAGAHAAVYDSVRQMRHLDMAVELLEKTRDVASLSNAIELAAQVRRSRGAPRDWVAARELQGKRLALARKMQLPAVQVRYPFI